MANLAKLPAEHHPDLAPDAEKAKTAADDFRVTGQIPVSLIRWEMTGLEDEIKKLG